MRENIRRVDLKICNIEKNVINSNSELIWQGRLHLGDEPGVYGNAQYVGLCAELPFTVMRNDNKQTDARGVNQLSDIVTIVLETDDVKTYPGYPGHEVLIIAHNNSGNKWEDTAMARSRFWDDNRTEINIDMSGKEMPLFLSARVRVDTSVPAGLYDDFVLKKLYLHSESNKYFAAFGFRPLQRWKGLLLLEKEQ